MSGRDGVLPAKWLDMLRHMLGINDGNAPHPKPYRNYAAVSPGDPLFLAMEAAGLVRMYRARGPSSSYNYYECTAAGEAAAFASFRAIRWPRAKRVYSKFLDVRERWEGLTFHQFLTDPQFAQTRTHA